MLRQVHIFSKGDLIFVKNYASALGIEGLDNIKKLIGKYMEMPLPNKTLTSNFPDYQIFHRGLGNLYVLFLTDLVDSLQYIDPLIQKTINKFKELFPNPDNIKEDSPLKIEFLNFMDQIQKDIHSKIAIIGPNNSGRTTLYDLLKSNDERLIMDFFKSSQFSIDEISFDIWDFQIKDNFSLLWPKFVSGSDLVILIFNLANYHLKLMDHFLSLQRVESPHSKLLVLGNKRDLIEDADLKRIKNELSISDFKEISLISPDAKSMILQYIREELRLKEKLPSDFSKLVGEVDNLVFEGKTVQALAKYKELLNISKSYQNIIYTKALEKKIEVLNEKIKEDAKKRKERESRRPFEIQMPLKFKKKVSVKPLPTITPLPLPPGQEQTPEKPSVIPEKSESKLVSFQKLEKSTSIKPIKTPEITPGISKKTIIPKLTPNDVEIELKDKVKKAVPKMPIELFTSDVELTKETDRATMVDYTRELQRIITEKGSDLSLQLCNQMVIDLEKSLGRALTIEDIQMAADFFVKQEKSL